MRLVPFLFLVACGDAQMLIPSHDAGHAPKGSGTAEQPDSGGVTPPEGGAPDAGSHDAGTGAHDSGTVAPPPDAGIQLVSPPPFPTYSGGTCPSWPTSGPDVQLVD